MKLRRLEGNRAKSTLTVPNHRELDEGTARAIFRQASKYIAADDLNPYFFTE